LSPPLGRPRKPETKWHLWGLGDYIHLEEDKKTSQRVLLTPRSFMSKLGSTSVSMLEVVATFARRLFSGFLDRPRDPIDAMTW
jgi:hypothetical protein